MHVGSINQIPIGQETDHTIITGYRGPSGVPVRIDVNRGYARDRVVRLVRQRANAG